MLKGIIITGDDFAGTIWPDCKGVILCGCKGIIQPGDGCFGIIIIG